MEGTSLVVLEKVVAKVLAGVSSALCIGAAYVMTGRSLLPGTSYLVDGAE